jgi:hypothetical protein
MNSVPNTLKTKSEEEKKEYNRLKTARCREKKKIISNFCQNLKDQQELIPQESELMRSSVQHFMTHQIRMRHSLDKINKFNEERHVADEQTLYYRKQWLESLHKIKQLKETILNLEFMNEVLTVEMYELSNS